jgi:hypothetical protein
VITETVRRLGGRRPRWRYETLFDGRVVIEAKARNAVALMAHPDPLDPDDVHHPEAILTTGGEWLRLQDSNLRPGG